jgi:Ca-activated chloride channel family protein
MKKQFVIFSVLVLLMLNSCSKEDSNVISSSGIYNNIPYTESSPLGERYNEFTENPFIKVVEQPLSTFSIDADGASYSNTRRFLNSKTLPPKDAIRVEEFINYFTYDYPQPEGEHPISVIGETCKCPWQTEHRLIRIGIKGKEIPRAELPPANWELLIDVSGSMSSDDKLEMLKKGFLLFVDELSPSDRLAIVTYAGSAGVVLPSTKGSEKQTMKNAISKLGAGGSTAGSQGISTAYEIAEKNFIIGGNNRVILGTDGDFNVGLSTQDELIKFIETKRDKGIFLTVLGVGTGNIFEGMMEQLANNGNGNYEYIDNIEQAKKVFIYEYSKFFTVAKDVKVQVTFNPDIVDSYRLIGYENRLLNAEDFTNDKKDAGEIGAGQCITALYEIVPKTISNLKALHAFEIDFRYKLPDSDQSNLINFKVNDSGRNFSDASESTRFAASVAGFGLLLRNSAYKGTLTYPDLINWTQNAKIFDPHGYRKEFISLMERAKGL